MGTPNQASLPSGFSPLGGASSCLLPPRVITVPFSGPASDWVKKLSGNQAVGFTSPGRQTVWVWCSVESAQLRERTWTGASHCTAAHSHLWVASHQTELSIARTKRQRRQPGWCAHLWAVHQGVKGGAWALHPDAIWIECVKGIPKSFSSALLFTNTGAN